MYVCVWNIVERRAREIPERRSSECFWSTAELSMFHPTWLSRFWMITMSSHKQTRSSQNTRFLLVKTKIPQHGSNSLKMLDSHKEQQCTGGNRRLKPAPPGCGCPSDKTSKADHFLLLSDQPEGGDSSDWSNDPTTNQPQTTNSVRTLLPIWS